MMKFSWAISRVKWLSSEQTNVSKTIPEDEDREGLRNVGLLTAQPFDLADSSRELRLTFARFEVFVVMKIQAIVFWTVSHEAM
jgi:hypothetical protein